MSQINGDPIYLLILLNRNQFIDTTKNSYKS